jgi:hypothetical protein
MRDKRTAYKIFVRNHEGQDLLRKPRRRRQYNIKMEFEAMGWEFVAWIHLAGYGKIPGSCKIGNEFSGIIKCWEFLD